MTISSSLYRTICIIFPVLCIDIIVCATVLNPNRVRTRNRRVINGYPTTIKSYPFVASLWNTENVLMCGGTIIDNKTILTAAHCLSYLYEDMIIGVRFGSTYVNTGEAGVLHTIADRTIHENFTLENFSVDDIGLIRLEKPIPINNISTQTVRLADHNSIVTDGSNATVIGWGSVEDPEKVDGNYVWVRDDEGISTYVKLYPDQLRAVDLEIISKQDCPRNPGQSLERSICTLYPGSDFCVGDSGGPLMVNGYQVGIISVGYCNALYPGYSVEVAAYRDWIEKKIKAWDDSDNATW